MGRFAYLNTEDESGRELLVELNMADYPDGGSIVFKSNGDRLDSYITFNIPHENIAEIYHAGKGYTFKFRESDLEVKFTPNIHRKIE